MQAARLHKTIGVKVGRFQVGGGAPVVIQSMTMTDTADARATAQQVIELAEAGSEMVRVTVNLPEAAAAVPEIKQRMLDAGCTVPLIGDFHYNGHLLLTRYPAVRRGTRQVPHQPGQRRHGPAPRRAVHDHLQGRRRARQTGAHRRQRRLPQPGARHAADAGQHRQGSRAHVRADPERRAWSCRRSSRRSWRSRLGCAATRSSFRARCRVRRDLVEIYRDLARRTEQPLHLG